MRSPLVLAFFLAVAPLGAAVDLQALTERKPEQAAERMSAHFTNGLQAAQ